MNSIVDTPRLLVRPFRANEEDVYLGLFEDERVTKYLPVRSRDELIAGFRTGLNEPPPGIVNGRWGIFSKTDQHLIGFCLLFDFDGADGVTELGYVLQHRYWGKGMATEVCRGLLQYVLTERPAASFAAVTTENNIASQRVLEKIGMHREGIHRRNNLDLALFRT